MEVQDKWVKEDNSYIFKRFVSHHPPIYDGSPDPKTFEDWIIGVWRNYSTYFSALRSEK